MEGLDMRHNSDQVKVVVVEPGLGGRNPCSGGQKWLASTGSRRWCQQVTEWQSPRQEGKPGALGRLFPISKNSAMKILLHSSLSVNHGSRFLTNKWQSWSLYLSLTSQPVCCPLWHCACTAMVTWIFFLIWSSEISRFLPLNSAVYGTPCSHNSLSLGHQFSVILSSCRPCLSLLQMQQRSQKPVLWNQVCLATLKIT